MSDDGPKVPKFAIVGLAVVGLIVLARYVAVPELASTTCAMVNWGCSVPGQLSTASEPGGFGGVAVPNNRSTRPSDSLWLKPKARFVRAEPRESRSLASRQYREDR